MNQDEKELLELHHLSDVYFIDPYPNYQTFRTAYLFDLPLSGMNETKLLNAIIKSGIDLNFNVRNKLKEKNISNDNLSFIFYDILIPNSPANKKDLDRLSSQHLDISASTQVLNKDVEEIEEKLEDAYNEGTKCPYCGAKVDFDDDICLSCYETIHVKCRFKLSKDENGEFIVSEKISHKKKQFSNGRKKDIPVHQKRRGIYISLAVITGLFGGHNFYARHIFNGILQLLLTLSLIGSIITIIWVISDVRSIKQDGKGIPFLGYEHCIQSSRKWGCFQVGSLVFLILLLIGLIMSMIEKINESKRQPQKIEQLKK